MSHPLLIFDLDGTLAHTAPDLIATLNKVCEPFGMEPVGMDDIGQLAGQGAKAMIARAFELNERQITAEEAETAFESFLNIYADNLAEHSFIYEGLEPLLHTYRDRRYPLAVCTNKLEKFAISLLQQLGVADLFSSVTGGDTFEFRKPDGRHVLETIRLAGIDGKNAIMIGDSINDISAAKDAGIPSIAVSFGYSDRPAEELGATHIIHHFRDLPEAVTMIEQGF